MRRLRIGFGVSLGLLFSASLWQCSFYLPERTLCTDLGCQAGPDQGSARMLDMVDPNDPSAMGSYGVATLNIPNPPQGLTAQTLVGPSDDGTTISPRQTSYPLVLLAPAENQNPASMQAYATRLASHGFIVGSYQVTDQSNHQGYRDTGLSYLNFLINNTDPSIKNHIDAGHLGLLGYELGAKISIAMALQDSRIGALFLIDPADLFTANGPIDGVASIGQVTLSNGGTIAILGDPLSTTGSNPCIQPPQKGYSDFYNSAKSPALAVIFNGANLGDFMNNFPNPACTAGSTAPQSQTQSLAMKYMVAYFQWTLLGETRESDYLLGSALQADEKTGAVTGENK